MKLRPRLILSLVFALILLTLSTNLSAKQLSTTETAEVLWDTIKVSLDSLETETIYFDLVKSNNSAQVAFLLTNMAFKEGYVVLDNKSSDATTVAIMLDNKTIYERHNYILFVKEDTYTYPYFLVNISQNERIVSSNKIYISQAISKKSKSSSRWYEPVMLSAVIGSLVYLIYYGNH
ncbi:MAG TPA: hypothetical protein PL063_06070 [Candidatus Cloacimonadota bacterium]|jgi:hypothetical protein|nr:hypothetical protein [Candidatus Cloacimonadales bacterium]HPY96761.1 hypothetical protein [Candidatus Cloacimonadota bacterium]HQB41403.1 hypothetical protein [Candidatus Cloacimonadota bacterium]